MARFGLTTCWLQISCSSQAELHWHDVCKNIRWFKMFSNPYDQYQITLIITKYEKFLWRSSISNLRNSRFWLLYFLERLVWEFLWGYTLQKEYNLFTLHFWVWLICVWVGLLHTFWWRKNPEFEIAESTREDQNEILNY